MQVVSIPNSRQQVVLDKNIVGKKNGKAPLSKKPQGKKNGKAPLRQNKNDKVEIGNKSQTMKNREGALGKTPPAKINMSAMKHELIRRAQMITEKFIDANVAFVPSEERWMPKKDYGQAGSAYLIGVVTRYEIDSKKNVDNIFVPSTLFQIRWTSTNFQKLKEHVHLIPEDVLVRGIQQIVKV
ncbi:hypothetical protein PHMEG_00014042 [Phytophthora megakarya]|uniref:Uncharacterized protein n=1 Tax=Phytophthora megakarya TaxID=4795 RepID=A0A225W6Z3_9STRA|nr:hypothetical protein PHMEG_00014042 [Phytophthora megakarya]